MELELIRTYHPDGTNGELLLNGDKVCSTIELPWKENKSRVSCIPEGRYELRKRYSPRFGHHFIVMNVQDRSFILMHTANDAMKELKGCIAPVTSATAPGRGNESKKAFAKIVMKTKLIFLKNEKVFITIKARH